ncbi:hypothetical protein [Rhizobium sp. S152]|uniref:hypothetical protein n=1 Tax=Rhizobium sp. S152 TaxID=3055038 RepID=UPI0030144CCD
MQVSALSVAEVHFPDQTGKMRRLYDSSEAFRGMCEDLAAAEETLAHVDNLPAREREDRRKEYGSLVEELVIEIGEALARANVVMLRRFDIGRQKAR